LQTSLSNCEQTVGLLSVIGCLHDPANVQQTSSKRPAPWHYICWKFAGRLLDRVNIPLILSLQINAHQVRQTFTAAAVATFSELLLQLKVAISEIVQKCQFLNMSKVGKGCKF